MSYELTCKKCGATIRVEYGERMRHTCEPPPPWVATFIGKLMGFAAYAQPQPIVRQEEGS